MKPIIQLVVAVIAVIFLVVAVVPTIASTFAEQGQKLPAPTRILLSISGAIQSYYLPILIFFVVLYVGYRYIKSTGRGGRLIDQIKLKIPFIGYFARIRAVVQFSQTLGLLIASGVNLSESLDIVVSIINNKILADTLKEARDKIIKQGKIAQYLKQTNLFPPIAIYMISTGEESGQLDTMLNTVANNYEEELAQIADRMTGLLSPIMLIVMSIVVGFIVASIAMPIINMTKGMMA
jgi:type IV pilus assembly protein PilC